MIAYCLFCTLIKCMHAITFIIFRIEYSEYFGCITHGISEDEADSVIIPTIFKYLSNTFALTSKIIYFRSAKDVHINVNHMYLFPRNCHDEIVNIFHYVAILGLDIEEILIDNDR